MRRLIVVAALALLLTGCGTTIVKTVTVTASPTPPGALSDSDIAGIQDFTDFLDGLRYVNGEINATLAYGARSKDLEGVLAMTHQYVVNFNKLVAAYHGSNGGHIYAGQVAPLDELFQDAATHVQKFGMGVRRLTWNKSASAAVNVATQRERAKSGIEDVGRELERLQAGE